MPKWTNEQLEAIHQSGQNIIVSAGAGSGKTAVLTERVITKLKQGIHINELLILTFTKAAALEMKERIRKSIKLENLIDELKYIDSAYITTFDSFSLGIVKRYHYLLNIDDNIVPAEATIVDIKRKEILDEIFEKKYQEGEISFLQMIDTFCTKDDLSIRKAILDISRKLELNYYLDDYLNTYLENNYTEQVINQYIIDYQLLIERKKEEIAVATDDLLRQADEKYSLKVNDYITPILESKDLEDLFHKLDETFPNLPRGSEDEVKVSKEILVNLLNGLKELLSYGNLDDIKEKLLGTRETVQVIISILKSYFQQLRQYKQQHHLYEFTDIANLAIKILQDNEEIRNEVKKSFKEIMIDEYQDTNDLQELFVSMIADDNVYMVGDIKQSIYRFRNANPYIFRGKYNRYQQHNGGMKIDLLKNFRSRREVLFDINYIFNQIMSDDLGGAEYSVSHQMIFGNTSYEENGYTKQDYKSIILTYENNNREYKKEEIEAFIIADDIKKKISDKYLIFDMAKQEKRACKYSDFVILMDRATSFELYKKIFEYLEIPLNVYKDEVLNDNEDIYLIKNMLGLLIEIERGEISDELKYNYVSVARSYLYELSDEEIFDIFQNNEFYTTSIYQQFKNIAIYLKNKSVYDLLISLIEQTNLYQKMLKVGDVVKRQVRIMKILELAINLGNNGYDIYKFKEYLDKLLDDDYEIRYALNNNNSNAVKIMTIHKSKGLEFPICYYAGLYKPFNISDLKEKFLYDNKYGFIVPYFDEGIRETILKLLLKENYIEEEIAEKIRLFYVGLTRAKEQMIMVLPWRELDSGQPRLIDIAIRKKYRSFADILYSVKGDIQAQVNNVDLENINLTKKYLYEKDVSRLVLDDSQKINVQELSLVVNQKEQQHYSKNLHELITPDISKNIQLGLDFHEVLEQLDFKKPRLDLIDDEFIRNRVSKFLNNSLLKNISNAEIYHEFEFIFEVNNIIYHGIIDCMIEYEDYIDIIDYKLKNVDDEAYLKQLHGYADYIYNKTNKKTNLYLYSILNGEFKKL